MMDIHHITFRTIAAATEGEDRVRTALSLFLFDNEIETVATEGHILPGVRMPSRLQKRCYALTLNNGVANFFSISAL